MRLVIVTGLSGSGKSTALNTLEDLGYYCIDNLPVGLLEAFAERLAHSSAIPDRQAAVGIDARNRPDELQRFPDILDRLKKQGMEAEVLFLRAEDPVLLQRYSETRRRHPLRDDRMALDDAIQREKELLEPILDCADVQIDTSRSNIHQLRTLVRDRVARETPGSLSLLFQSFGYKHGIPSDADFVFDARCLPNPHWEPALRPLTGLNPEVADFLGNEPMVAEMLDSLIRFLDGWIPRFADSNRSYISIAVGCTGGHHRSVYLAQELARHFKQTHQNVMTRHRELS